MGCIKNMRKGRGVAGLQAGHICMRNLQRTQEPFEKEYLKPLHAAIQEKSRLKSRTTDKR